MDKTELIITALQQRIGQMAADYELQMAILRAEFTELKNEYDLLKGRSDKQNAIDEYESSLINKI